MCGGTVLGGGKLSDGQGRPDGVPVLQSLPLGLSGIGGGQVCAGSPGLARDAGSVRA